MFDPYDIWATDFLGKLKVSYTKGNIFSKVVVMFVGVLELIAPVIFRRLLKVKKNFFPHVAAMQLLIDGNDHNLLNSFKDHAIPVEGGVGWGLPFKWFSKNGVYGSNTAYVTNTPYVMEALVSHNWPSIQSDEAVKLFYLTLFFLNSLKVLHNTESELALSYAPVDEPRMVINANSYAALGYALHVVHGEKNAHAVAKLKVIKLVNWILNQQLEDGSWFYYADKEPGNFIDCFHSCFIIKNLIKVKKYVPELESRIDPAIHSGWIFLKNNFYDEKTGLCRRFIQKDLKDPFKWDLYDQAEYLGLLVDFGMYNEATIFSNQVEKIFKKEANWYCRIDFLGRRWGRNFNRWGIVPFIYHNQRLLKKTKNKVELCVE